VHTDRWLDVLFGKGDDEHPFWLMGVRTNILLFLLCVAVVVAWNLAPARLRRLRDAKGEACIALALTTVAGVLRFLVAGPNLMDFGGIPYSRLLLGYKGHFATAQLYSLYYELTTRDIEHAIFLDRVAGTLTIPLVYVLCRRLRPGARCFAAVSAFLFAVYPLHVLLSASDALPVFSIFLTATSYLLLLPAGDAEQPPVIGSARLVGGLTGLALLTQVRYENALFLLPVVPMLYARRRLHAFRALFPAAAVAAAFVAFYAYEAITSGLSFQNPVDLRASIDVLRERIAPNRFLALPPLLVGTLAVGAYEGPLWGLLALLPWVAAVALSVFADSAVGAARVYASWLILIRPAAGYGFSLLLRAAWRPAKLLAVAVLLYLGAQPFLARDAVTARYLEIRENDLFEERLAALPSGAKWIIVPDDELLRREFHSTNEVSVKYSMILATHSQAPPRMQLVRLTDYLEHPERTDCWGDACVFFFGLPCLDQHVYPFTREQCLEILRTHRSSLIDETTVVAAPFLDCGIYTGGLRRRLCDPTTKTHRFAFYRVERAEDR
jgi:hypothetical protein